MKYTLSELKREVFKDVYRVYGIFQDFFGDDFVDLQFEDVSRTLPFKDEYWIPSNIEADTLSETDLTEDELSEARTLGARWNSYIYVWWPTVTITNENNRSVTIKDLYAKIQIAKDGTIPFEYSSFTLLRATYSYIHFKAGYVHSHVPHMYKSEAELKRWRDFCLGRSSFRNTILDLHNNSDDAMWMLFCQELSLCVTIESLQGGPYYRMEEIGTGNIYYRDYILNMPYQAINKNTIYKISRSYCNTEMTRKLMDTLRQFIPYYLEHGHLSFNYQNGKFIPGMPYFDFMIDISNTFIEWFNTCPQVITKEEVYKYLMEIVSTSNRKFYRCDTTTEELDYSSYEGLPLLTFKGREIKLHIEALEQHVELNKVSLLSYEAAQCILSNILTVINYRYKNEHTEEHKACSDDSADTTTPCEKILYI